MDKGLEQLIEVLKPYLNLNEKDEEEIKKQLDYLEYAFYDVLANYGDKKISIDSLIIFFGYLFGNLIENDNMLDTFINITKGMYLIKKFKKYML